MYANACCDSLKACDEKAAKEAKEREKRWRAESDLRSLIEAKAIKKDAERIAEVKKLLKDQISAVGVFDEA